MRLNVLLAEIKTSIYFDYLTGYEPSSIGNKNSGNVGDIELSVVIEKCSATPVPGGVGPMTIAMLITQTLEAAEKAAG